MSGSGAFLAFAAGIGVLFFLNRDKSSRSSKALWLPVVWLWIIGSRTPSMWLGGATGGEGGLDGALEGNSTDAAIFMALIAGGVMVLLGRKAQTRACLKPNVVVLVYFLYCLASCIWSPFPGVALKRWIKAAGDLVMVLVILTDPEPVSALRRIYSRVGFILLPASVFLIRYTSLGRGFDVYGNPADTGVTTNKNTLGEITFVIALGAAWNVLLLLRGGETPGRGRRLVAQATLLSFGIGVLNMAHSATSISCFLLGSVLMLATGLRGIRRSPSRVHALILTITIAAGLGSTLGADALVVHSLGRKSDLTGRTDIWKTVLPMAQNALIGEGFESFWNASSTRLKQITGDAGNMYRNLNSAHNGYIDVYLNIGAVGLSLIGMILISGYRHICRTFRADSDVGGLFLAHLFTAVVYSVTEAGFRLLTPPWFFLLAAAVGANAITKGYVRSETTDPPRVDGRELGWRSLLVDKETTFWSENVRRQSVYVAPRRMISRQRSDAKP